MLAASRIAYARKHRGTLAALLEQLGVGIGALSTWRCRSAAGPARRGYAAALGWRFAPAGNAPLAAAGSPAPCR